MHARLLYTFAFSALLLLSSAGSASALAIYEAWAIAGITIPDGVAAQVAMPTSSISQGVFPFDNPASSVDTSTNPGGPGTLPPFQHIDLGAAIPIFDPTDLDFAAAAYVVGQAGPPDTSEGSAAAGFNLLLSNPTDQDLVFTVVLTVAGITYAEVDSIANESAMASAFALTPPPAGESLSIALGEGPFSNAFFVQREVEVILGGFEQADPFSFEASVKGEATSNIPEPSVALLLGLGVLGLGARRQRVH